MPGLYGVIPLDGTQLKREDSESFLALAGDRLSHRADYLRCERIDKEGRFAVGRIGLPESNRVPWPDEEPPSSELLFVSGVLHGDLPPAINPERRPGSELAGTRLFSNLRGFYAALWFDASSSTTVIGVDRSASTPLYYTRCTERLYFASEVKALVDLPGFSRKLDLSAAANLLASGFMVEDQTLFDTVKRLPGGELLSLHQGRLTRGRYYVFRPGNRAGEIEEGELRERFRSSVVAAVERNLTDPDRTAIFLSGGVDSRGLLAASLRAADGDGSRLHTVTWGADVDQHGSDAHLVTELAVIARTDHRFIRQHAEDYASSFVRYNRLIDALCDMSAAHARQVPVMEALSEAGFRAVFRGDEVFGYKAHVRDIWGALKTIGIRRFRSLPHMQLIVRGESYSDMVDGSDSSISRLVDRYAEFSPDQAKDIGYFENRLQNYLQGATNFRRSLFDNRNVYTDEEILDVMEFAPDRLRFDKVMAREELRALNPELWQVALAKGTTADHLPDEERAVEELLRQQLDDGECGIWDLLDPRAVGELILGRDGEWRRPAPAGPLRLGLRRVKPWLKRVLPASGRLEFDMSSRWVTSAQIAKRILVLKDWYDGYMPER